MPILFGETPLMTQIIDGSR